MKNKIISIIVEVIVLFLLWYIMLPPLNLSAPEFWSFLLFVVFFTAVIFLPSAFLELFKKQKINRMPKVVIWVFEAVAGFAILLVIVNVICSPLFSSSKYANRISVDELNKCHLFTFI